MPLSADEEFRRVLRALQRIGDSLTAETLAAYNRARMELRGRLADALDNDDRLTSGHVAAILVQVEDRLVRLAGELDSVYTVQLGRAALLASNAAVQMGRRLFTSEEIAALATRGMMTATVPHDVVNLVIREAGQHIVAVNAQLRATIRREMTAAVIQGKPVKVAAREILAAGITTDGVKAFPSAASRAEAIARTETSIAYNAVKLDSFARMAEDVPGLKVRWLAAPCRKDCDYCHTVLNGQLRTPWTGDMFEGGRRPLSCPPAHPRCKCVLVAKVER